MSTEMATAKLPVVNSNAHSLAYFVGYLDTSVCWFPFTSVVFYGDFTLRL